MSRLIATSGQRPTTTLQCEDTAAKPQTLEQQVTSGKFKEALEWLNGRSMEDLLNQLEKLGFANASYLLANLGAARSLGPTSLARLETAIRTIGIRQTGTTAELLFPLLDAVHRAGIRNLGDQFTAIQHRVMPPAAGWASVIGQYLTFASMAEFMALSSAGDAFRVLDFVTDGEQAQALRLLNEKQLRLLIANNRAADRYEGERIRRALDAAWRAKFPLKEPPWPKAITPSTLNLEGMSVMDKLAEAIKRSEKYGGEEIKGKIAELVSPKSLAFIAGTTVLFAALELASAGSAGVALAALSVVLVGPEVITVAADINGFISTAVQAKTEADLELAGEYFAKAAVAISIDILVAVLLHKPTKAATPRIQAGIRKAGVVLKNAAESTELMPALAIAGDSPPGFFQAPGKELAARESAGAAKTGKPAPTDYANMRVDKLRELAKTDKEAAEALLDRYRVKSDAQLRRMGDDPTAQAVLRQRTSPNDAELARIQGSDYRPPHTATLTIRRGGVNVVRETLNSGNMTEAEAALGYPRNSLATHTEARAVGRPDIQPGDVMTIDGQYEPCSSCVRAMNSAARWLGIRIHYQWSGGIRTFP